MWVLIAFLFFVFVYYHVRNRHVNKLLSQFPGPKPYFLLGNIPEFWGKREDIFRYSLKIFNDHFCSPLIVTWVAWRPEIFVVKAKAAEALLNNSQMIDKGKQYRYLHPWLGFGLLTSTGAKWHSRRKLLTPTFHFKILEEFFPIILKQANVLTNILKESVAKGENTLDIYPYMARCTLDIICETAMGKTISAQHNHHSPYVKAVNEMGEIFLQRSIRPWLDSDWVFAISSYGFQQRKCLKLLHGFTDRVISEKRTENKFNNSSDITNEFGQKKRLAFLDLLLDSSSNLSDKDLREEVDTFMFEGHDTTTSGATWILYHIGKYPEVQTKIRLELIDILKGNILNYTSIAMFISHCDPIVDDYNRSFTIDDMKQMKYLECVIKESMRLKPPVPYFSRSLTKEATICGLTIPAGVDINVSTYMVHRDPEFYPDPENFDPARFKTENQMANNKSPFAYIPFSAGPRNCIGQKFAMMEEKVVIAHIVRNFWIKLLEPEMELVMLAELILRPATGMWLILEKQSLDNLYVK